MRPINLFIAFLLFTTALTAQNDKRIDDLIFLFVDGKYDKLVYKGESLIDKDDYRKHPLPYIYVSMAYYEMSKRPGKYSVGEKDSEFRKPLKDAQKYLYKFIKKDAKASKYYDNSWYNDFKEYYLNIADTSNKLGQYLYLNDDYRKAASVYKYASRAVPDDPILKLWLGICYIKAKNTPEGKTAIYEAMKEIDENFKPSKSTSSVLAHGMVLAEEIFRGKLEDYKNADKAKKLIEVFKKYDPDQLDKKKMDERKENAKKDDRVMKKFFSDEDDEDNINRKGKIIIKDGYGSDDDDIDEKEDELDKIEKEAGGGY